MSVGVCVFLSLEGAGGPSTRFGHRKICTVFGVGACTCCVSRTNLVIYPAGCRLTVPVSAVLILFADALSCAGACVHTCVCAFGGVCVRACVFAARVVVTRLVIAQRENAESQMPVDHVERYACALAGVVCATDGCT